MQKLALFIVLFSALFAGGCRPVNIPSGNNAAVSNTPPKAAAPSAKDPKLIRGTVVHISDGDTFIVQSENGERTTIRTHAIDAPELAQTFGKESREQLRALIANQTVEVRRQKTDQFHRTVGEVFMNGKDVGLEMVSGGYAWHFKQYQKEQSPEDRKLYADAEQAARTAHLGLWRELAPVPPQDYRREHGTRR